MRLRGGEIQRLRTHSDGVTDLLPAATLGLLAVAAGLVTVIGPSPFVGFIGQMYLLGSIVGTVIALVRFRRHPDDPRWAPLIAGCAVAGAVLGLLIQAVDAVV